MKPTKEEIEKAAREYAKSKVDSIDFCDDEEDIREQMSWDAFDDFLCGANFVLKQMERDIR